MHAYEAQPQTEPNAIAQTPAPPTRVAHMRAIHTHATPMRAPSTHTSYLHHSAYAIVPTDLTEPPHATNTLHIYIYICRLSTPLCHKIEAPSLLAPHTLYHASRILHPTPHILHLTAQSPHAPSRNHPLAPRRPPSTTPTFVSLPRPSSPYLASPYLARPTPHLT